MPPSTFPPQRPSREPSFAISTRQLGLYVLLASLCVLFAASLVGYFITRSESAAWRTPEMAGLPAGLWLSSAFVLAISVFFELALSDVRGNRLQSLRRRLWITLLLGLAFLTAQIFNWREMHQATLGVSTRTLYPYTFYLLTGLHAAHVLGGLIPLGIVLQRAGRREYSSSRYEGLALCAQYWHFLSVVWVVLFAALEIGSD